jgi:hypothetical protein
MQAGTIGGYVARRRLLGHPAAFDSGSWYRPKHAAPSRLLRIARRLSVALALAEFSGYSQRPANVARPQWPRLTVVGIEATAVRRAA